MRSHRLPSGQQKIPKLPGRQGKRSEIAWKSQGLKSEFRTTRSVDK
jgi:hypothetical protein